MKTRQIKLQLFVAMLFIFFGIYLLLDTYKSSRVEDILTEHAKYLDISYKQGIDRFQVISTNIYLELQNDETFVNLLAKTTTDNLDEYHKKIYEHLEKEFYLLRMSGIMGIQVINTEEVSVVRMHKKEKYGDHITLVRPMLKDISVHHLYVHGFEEGKTSHAYREAYPIYKDGKYVGAVEILFSSTKLQDYTMKASGIKTHFIVNKNVFDLNAWKSNVTEPYDLSIEHKDYLYSLNKYIEQDNLEQIQELIIEPLRTEIERKMQKHQEFQLYTIADERANIVVFKPIQRFVDKKTVAYLVAYSDSQKLYNLVENIFILKIMLVIVLLVAYIILAKLLEEKESVLHSLKFDGLTNTYNRKYFMNLSYRKLKQIEMNEGNYCIVMVDIDFFKDVNDTYGHQYGDDVLKEFATILKSSIRGMDIVARYGGEEFILLICANANNTYKVISEILQKIQKYPFGEKGIPLTASFGMAESKGKSSIEALIKKADDALYRAKEGGRNRIEM